MSDHPTAPIPSRGRVTLPAESGQEDTVLEMLAQRWGADYIRDSDGTALVARAARARTTGLFHPLHGAGGPGIPAGEPSGGAARRSS